jgi:hypothetical protein
MLHRYIRKVEVIFMPDVRAPVEMKGFMRRYIRIPNDGKHFPKSVAFCATNVALKDNNGN